MKYQVSRTAMLRQRSQAKTICFSVVLERPRHFGDVAVSVSCSVAGRRGSSWSLTPGTLESGPARTGASSYGTCHVSLTLLMG